MDFSYMQPPSAQEPVLWTVRRTPRVSKLHFDVLAWVASFGADQQKWKFLSMNRCVCGLWDASL